MWNRLLAFLSWAGLWQAPLQVLNRDAPVLRLAPNASHVTDITSDFMKSVVDGYVSDNGQQVSYLALEQSALYQTGFNQLGTVLQSADPRLMDATQRKAFFINLYNLLTIHAIASMDSLPRSTISVLEFWRRYAYQVGPFTLHLDDIEHGILRGNRPHPTSGTTMFSVSDPRLALSLPADHRIHGALNCGAMSCPLLKAFEEEHLEEQLDEALETFLNRSVTLLPDGSLAINSIFNWFRVDFGPSEASVLQWLAGQISDANISQALIEASQGRRHTSYEYDWTLNAVSGTGGSKVKVVVYFSSLCSDTMHFFRTQLYPAWTQLQDIMDLEFVPYGKARATPSGTGDYTFVCQHGPNECHGNKVMSCIQNAFPIATQMELLHCMMGKSYPAYAGSECSREVGVEWASVSRCADATDGAALLYKNGVRTAALKPSVYFIPTITVDGHYSRTQLRNSLDSLKNQICSFYQGPPHQNCL